MDLYVVDTLRDMLDYDTTFPFWRNVISNKEIECISKQRYCIEYILNTIIENSTVDISTKTLVDIAMEDLKILSEKGEAFKEAYESINDWYKSYF